MTKTSKDVGALPTQLPSSTTRLSGNLGATSLVLSVLAFSAPIVTVSGYIAFAIGFVGETAPLAWVVATIGLAIFSVGYTTMTKHIKRPGAFYAYISLGLGKTLGLGGAYLATVSYMLITVGIYTFTGTMVSSAVEALGGPIIPWYLCTAASWIVITVLGHFQIELSAKVLGIVMVLEIILVAIFNVVVLGKGGESGLSVEPLNPAKFLNAGTGMALLFAFGNFVGFEATALYRDEVRNPGKTIPRATYMAVFLIGGFYAISAYSMITAYGSSAVSHAVDDPTTMFDSAMATYVSSSLATVTLVLVATSALASVLSTHNVVARYLQNLGADHALPSFLAAVHPVHKSPYKASGTNSVLVGVLLILGGLIIHDEDLVIGTGSGLGTAGVLSLMALVSFAVVRYFAMAGRPAGESVWRVKTAPLIAAFILCAVVVFALVRFDLLVGGEPGERLWLLLIPILFISAGCLVAIRMKRLHPNLYGCLGRAEGDRS